MDRDSFSQDQDLINILKGLESNKAEYPPELLAARRKLFIDRLKRPAKLYAVTELSAIDDQLMEVFRRLKSLDPEYPSETLARRRSIFRHQIEETGLNSVWNVLRTRVRDIFGRLVISSRSTSVKFARASSIALGIAMLAFVTSALYGSVNRTSTVLLPPTEIPTRESSSATATPPPEIICKDGYSPPLCLAQKMDNSQNLTYPGNGTARPAVAKDTVPGFENVHLSAYANDGLYGPGASWVSNSPHSWIKIDLGDTKDINTVAFSRDRLGMLDDGHPGQFVIAVAMADNIYADGNSSNDEREYINVYNSQQAGFDGIISGSDVVVASFKLQRARFIKITFENAGTAIDEVEAFVSRPAQAKREVTKASPRGGTSPNISTPIPTHTSLPLNTASPMPTNTALPVNTATPIPVNTATLTPVDTATPLPVNTATLTPVDTATPIPVGTATPIPVDTATPLPADTNTSIPTDPLPPQDTPVPTQASAPQPFESVFPPPVQVPIPFPPPANQPPDP